MYEPQSMVKQLSHSKLWGTGVAKGLLLLLVIIAMLSGIALAADGKVVFEEQGRTRINLAYAYIDEYKSREQYKLSFDLEVHGWFWDDTTIALQCEWFERYWLGNYPGELTSCSDFFKTNISDPRGAEWLIKDHVNAGFQNSVPNVVLQGHSIEHSPDGSQAIYFPDSYSLGRLTLADLKAERNRTIAAPDSVILVDMKWNPIRNIVLMTGGLLDISSWLSADEDQPNPPFSRAPELNQMNGPVEYGGLIYYLFDPTKDEFRPVYVVNQLFLGKSLYYSSAWLPDGRAFIFAFYDFAHLYHPCSPGETCTFVVGRYDLDSDSVTVLYQGPRIKGFFQPDLRAYDTSLVFLDLGWPDDVRNKKPDATYTDFNPLTGRIDTVWTSKGRANIGTPFLSPDRRFVAYYASGHLFVDKVGAKDGEHIYTTAADVGGNQMTIGFDRSGRKLFYVEKSSKPCCDIELVWGELKDAK
jgi:hypothetical protein